jgi:mitochondrial import inner membrane translocase subunit TIM23
MILHTDVILRTAAIGCRLQPSITPCAYPTATQALQRRHAAFSTLSRRRTLKAEEGPPFSTRSHAIVRYSSSIPSPANAVPVATSRSIPLPSDLDWNTFFQLRKSRRRYQLGGSICTSLFSMAGGAQSLAHSDMDWIVGQIPLDPFITLGLITFSCGGIGWLLGPVIGTGIFNTLNRKYIAQMAMVSLGCLTIPQYTSRC